MRIIRLISGLPSVSSIFYDEIYTIRFFSHKRAFLVHFSNDKNYENRLFELMDTLSRHLILDNIIKRPIIEHIFCSYTGLTKQQNYSPSIQKFVRFPSPSV